MPKFARFMYYVITFPSECKFTAQINSNVHLITLCLNAVNLFPQILFYFQLFIIKYAVQLYPHFSCLFLASKMRIFLAVFLIAATSAEFQSRIHGGISNKTITSFVHLEIVFDRGTKYCGGVLVSPGDRILTAGSCVYE